MSSLDTKYQFRDEIFRGFSLHLLGPSIDDEVLRSQPSETYSIGMLYPRNVEEEQKVDDVAINKKLVDDEDEEVASLSNLRFPATMGLTFAIAGSAEQIIHVSVSSGKYLSVGDEWVRTPIIIEKPEIPNHIDSFYYDISKAKRELDWSPKFSFKDMLYDFIKEGESEKYSYLIDKRKDQIANK